MECILLSHTAAASGTVLGETGAETSPLTKTTEGSRDCNACRGWTQADGAGKGEELQVPLPAEPLQDKLHVEQLPLLGSIRGHARGELAEGQESTQHGWDSPFPDCTEIMMDPGELSSALRQAILLTGFRLKF